jgi:hypothetical protein
VSEKDARIATARREKPFPTLEQVKHVISTMPDGSELERRNRALVAFALLTGARDSAIASMFEAVDLPTRQHFTETVRLLRKLTDAVRLPH